MAQQRLADAFALLRWRDIRVAHERHVALVLQAHDAEHAALFLRHPEHHVGADLPRQLLRRHVRLVPAIRGYHAAIGLGRGIDDGEHLRSVGRAREPDVHR